MSKKVGSINMNGTDYRVRLEDSLGDFALTVENRAFTGVGHGEVEASYAELAAVCNLLTVVGLHKVCKYWISYTIITEESSESGEEAETGYIVGHNDVPFPDDLCGEAAAKWHIDNDVEEDIDPEFFTTTVDRLLRNYTGVYVNGDNVRQGDSQQDTHTGDYRDEAVHFDGCSDAQIAWIMTRLGR